MSLNPIVGRLHQRVACVNSRILCEEPRHFSKLATCNAEARNSTLAQYIARWGTKEGKYYYQKYVGPLPSGKEEREEHKLVQAGSAVPLLPDWGKNERSHKVCNPFSNLPSCQGGPQSVVTGGQC